MNTAFQAAIARIPANATISHSSETWAGELRRNFAGDTLSNALRVHDQFVERYPTLSDWTHAPLELRLGRLRGEDRSSSSMTEPLSYRSRRYILWCAMKGIIPLPWAYLLMLDNIRITDLATQTGHQWLPDRISSIIERAVAIDWSMSSASQAISFCLPRFALRAADPTVVERLTGDDFEAFRGEIREVYATVNPECNTRWKGEDRRSGRGALSAAFGAHSIHFQLGLVADGPHRSRPHGQIIPMSGPTEVVSAVEIWLKFDADTRGDRTRTNVNHNLYLRYFLSFLAEKAPHVERLDQLDRATIIDFVSWLKGRATLKDPRKKLADGTRRSILNTLSMALTELYENELAPAPSRVLIHRGDYPKVAKRLPRFITKKDMAEVIRAVREISDPYQLAALLVARWGGARRDEINRLELDCLDIYADGTYRLRIPAGKSRKERSIPLADEAAHAIEHVRSLRSRDSDIGTIDRVTGERVRYLFMARGRLLSKSFLFDTPLLEVCKKAGLVNESGGHLVTPHRFRHTLGTELVEAGARCPVAHDYGDTWTRIAGYDRCVRPHQRFRGKDRL